MTPLQFKRARRKLGLSAAKMAAALRVSGGRTVRRWETGEREIPGPVELCIEYLLRDQKAAKEAA